MSKYAGWASDSVGEMEAMLGLFGEAFAGEELAGGIAACVLDKFERERGEIYFHDLAVASARRRQGVATAMIRALQAIAAGRGAHVLFVQADLGDEPAIALYMSLGTREEVLHFDIPVGPAGSGFSA